MKKEHYVFGLFLVLLMLLFGYEGYVFSSYGHHASMHGGGISGLSMMGVNWTFWIFLILLLALAYLLIKDRGERVVERNDALEILEKRYAMGEITRDEYLQIFKDLIEKK
ncbi:MAG: SHOCT domain-containing protein [Candidatus Hydrothermarchaeales archaeon]